VGRLDWEALEQLVPDFKNRIFYLSGSNAMVEGYKALLIKNKIKKTNIKTDYFPGF
jgi:ferredoxin-NADP reductase